MEEKTANRVQLEQNSIHNSKNGFNQAEKQERNCKSICTTVANRLKKILTNITVEPVLFTFFVAALMGNVLSQSLIIRKFCRIQMGMTDGECRNLTQNKTLETEAQGYAADFMMYKTMVDTLPNFVWGLFLGSWSDKYGRKTLLVLPNIGCAVAMLLWTVNAYYDADLDVTYTLFTSLVLAFSGSFSALGIGGMSYIADITTAEQRTLRFGIASATFLCGAPVGLTIGSQLFKYMDYKYEPVFIISGCLMALNALYVIFFIKESVVKKNDKNMCLAFFNVKNVKEVFQTLLRKREDNGRLHLFLLILASVIVYLPTFAQYNLTYLYTRLRYEWDEVLYSNLTTAELIFSLIGLMVCLPILSKWLKLKDVTIGMVGTIARVSNDVIVAFSNEGWMLYAASPILIPAGLSHTVIRTMMSKTVAPDEQGKISALLQAAEGIMPTVSSFTFNPLYQATKDSSFPGTIFLVSAGLTVISFGVLMLVSYNECLLKAGLVIPSLFSDLSFSRKKLHSKNRR